MLDKMRILQINLSADRGGAYSSVKNLSRGFNKIGHYSQEIFQNPIDSLKQFNYDGVLLHSFQGRYISEYLEVLYFLEKYKINYIVLLHDYWSICPQTNLIRFNDGIKECDIGIDKCDPFVCGFYKKEPNPYILDNFDLFKVKEIYNIIKNSKTTCFNKYSVNIFKKNGFNNIKLIYHGVDFDLFKPYENEHDFTILFTNAWGEKELKGFKHWQWLKQNSDGVIFKELLGSKSFESMPSFYNEGNCLLFLSLWPETFGLVILEALACNLPIISYPIGIAPEIIQDGVNGYLMNSFNAGKVQEAIEKIRHNEYNCRDSIKDFSVENMCQRYIEFLK